MYSFILYINSLTSITAVDPTTETIHRKVLIKNRLLLQQTVDIKYSTLLDELIASDILNMVEVDAIRAARGEGEQINKLIDILCKKTYTAYRKFIQALVNDNQEHVAKLLSDTEKNLKQEQKQGIHSMSVLLMVICEMLASLDIT